MNPNIENIVFNSDTNSSKINMKNGNVLFVKYKEKIEPITKEETNDYDWIVTVN